MLARVKVYIYTVYINIRGEDVPHVELPLADYQLRGNEHVGGIGTVDTDVLSVVQIRLWVGRFSFR